METKKIETPVEKHQVELKLWLTGRDMRNIESVIYEDMDLGIDQMQPRPDLKITGLTGKIILKREDRLIEAMIVSIDGATEGILDRYMDMHDEDCKFVLAEIKRITEKKTE